MRTSRTTRGTEPELAAVFAAELAIAGMGPDDARELEEQIARVPGDD